MSTHEEEAGGLVGGSDAGFNDAGLEFAARHLEALGLEIVARRLSTRWGEIDLIAHDDRCVVFCAVRTRLSGTDAPPVSVGEAFHRRMRRMAAAWLADPSSARRLPELRFDLIGVTLDSKRRLIALEHLADAP